MSTDIIKTRNDITLDEIEELMRKEKDIKVYKKLFYVRFRIMGYTKIESYTLANIKSDKSGGLLLLSLLRTQHVPFETLGSSQPLSSLSKISECY